MTKQSLNTRRFTKSDDQAQWAIAFAIVMNDAEARQAILALASMIVEHPTVSVGIILLGFAALAREVIRDASRYQ